MPAYFSLYLKEDGAMYKYGIPHPCGRQLEIRSFYIPKDDGIFDVEFIFEMSLDGEKLNSWPEPLGATLVGFSGNQLYYQLSKDNDDYAFVTDDGKIGVLSDKEKFKITIEECPDVKGDPDFSKHYFCSKVVHLKSGVERMFAKQPVCT